MREEENIRAVAALHPEYMGFIFYSGSKRFVGNGFNVPADFPERIKRVGVFVHESTNEILRLAKKHELSVIQFHGGEPLDDCEKIRASGLLVIKVFSVDASFDFEETKRFASGADYFMFDTKGQHYGGNGIAFDWDMLRKYDQRVPFFLSGGLTLGNREKIKKLKDLNVHALDLNSGVEIRPGLKDVDLIGEWIEKFTPPEFLDELKD